MNLTQITKITSPIFHLLDSLKPAWWLLIRIWIAVVFFKAGLTKIDDFETTVFLFTEEYQVPLLPPYFAALSGTFFELVCPVLLVLGIATRFAALPLLAMTIVIQFTYLDHLQHYYWGILLLGLIAHGAGCWSVDAIFKKKCGSTCHKQ